MMPHGTWEGHGTWRTSSGPDLGGAAAAVVAVLIGGAALLTAVRALLWWIAAAAGVSLIGAVVLAVWLIRRGGLIRGATLIQVHDRDPATLPPLTVTAEQVTPAPAPVAAIEAPAQQHLHFHFADDKQAARIIRAAIPGQSGDIITIEE